MPPNMARVRSLQSRASGREMRRWTWRTPPSNTRYSAHAGEVLGARHLDPRGVPGGAEPDGPGCDGCGRRSSRRGCGGGRTRRRAARSRRAGCRSTSRLAGRLSGFHTWWCPNTSTGRSARAQLVEPLELVLRDLARGLAGMTVSSTARVTPGSSTRRARPGERLAVVAVVVAAHVRQTLAERPAVVGEELLELLGRCRGW